MTKAIVRAYDEAARREVGHWPGVIIVGVEIGGSNAKLILAFEGRTRYCVRPQTPSDHRGAKKHAKDIRRVCAELGAKRSGKG